MSCNGCRVLRKGCNNNCTLRQSLRGIDTPEAQANAALFVAKFFGRASLMSFISAVPESQRPVLFQSLLFEACGRTVNKVNGAVGLLWTGNWHVCQSAVETVLRGGALCPTPDGSTPAPGSEVKGVDFFRSQDLNSRRYKSSNRDGKERDGVARLRQANDPNLSLTSSLAALVMAGGRMKRRADTPSEESDTTTLESVSASNRSLQGKGERKLLRLFI